MLLRNQTYLWISEVANFGVQIIFGCLVLLFNVHAYVRFRVPSYAPATSSFFPLLLLLLTIVFAFLVVVSVVSLLRVHRIFVFTHSPVVERRVHHVPAGRRPYSRRPLQYLHCKTTTYQYTYNKYTSRNYSAFLYILFGLTFV